MENAPVVSDSVLFPASDRGRLERLWCALLAVLIECWHSERMLPTIRYAGSVTDMSRLVSLLRQSRHDGTTKLLVECRHYMFHRDRRSYWDKGRQCPLGRFDANDQLHMAFSDVLLAATQHANYEAQRLGIHFPGPMASDLPWPKDGPANPTGELPE